MSTIGKPERETQNRVIALFRDELHYRYLGDRADRPNNTNIDEDLLGGYLDRESHYLWGKRYLLKVTENDEPPQVELKHSKMLLRVRPGTGKEKMQSIIEAWYREQLKQAVPPLIARWEPTMRVKVARFFVQRMKTKWGSCSPVTSGIRLNTELAKKPRECLEYIVVHEMVHLLAPTHNRRFVALMEQFMPKWQFYAEVLNRLPVHHERWRY